MARPQHAAFDKKKIVAANRRARFDYAIDEVLEAGIMLTGTEVKSLRTGKSTIAESYAHVDRHGEAWERYNQEFHEALISNCRSRWLLLYRRSMYDHSLRYRMLSLKTKPFPRSQSALEHKLILDAALARDAERAVELLAAPPPQGLAVLF